jgi:hypothetical protein
MSPHNPFTVAPQLITYFFLSHLGDLPAREYEAGNNVGGSYPCPCGVNIEEAASGRTFFNCGPYNSLRKRWLTANASPTIKHSGAINIATLKVSQVLHYYNNCVAI